MTRYVKQHVKKVLMVLPPVRRYLSQKYFLDAAWKSSSAERDRFLAELTDQRVATEVLTADRDALAQKCTQLSAETERQSRTLKAILAERDTLTRWRDELQVEVERQRSELQALVAERDTLRCERDGFQGDVERERSQMQALVAERDRLQGNVERQGSELQALVAERDTLRHERDGHQGNVERQRSELQALVAERDTLRHERDGLQGDVERQRSELQALVAERDTLRHERDGLQGDVERQRREMQALVVERDTLRRERDAVQGDIGRQQKEMQALVVERDTLRRERDAVQGDIGRQQKEMQGLVVERDTLRRERDAVQGDIGRQQKEMHALIAERDSLKLERGQLMGTLSHYELQLENLAVERQRLYDERRKYNDAMLGKLSVVQAEYGSLERSLTHLTNTSKEMVSAVFLRNAYLNLLEDALTGIIFRDESIAPGQQGYDGARRELGRDWPKYAPTMIGKVRMRNIRDLAETILSKGVPGDFLEAGVWRGGACIYMRGILKAYGIEDRRVWVADSFSGLPPPSPELYPADAGDRHHLVEPLIVSLDEVRANFSKYGLLDDSVRFLEGWFKDTLPVAPVERLSLLRLDGDMYESTIQTLDAMYWKLSPGGFVIVDDYVLSGCRQAVDDFRTRHGIRSSIEEIDGAAVYWQKLANEQFVSLPKIPKERPWRRQRKPMKKRVRKTSHKTTHHRRLD